MPVAKDLVSDYPNLTKLVIGGRHDVPFVAFDPEARTADGEMAVVWVTAEGEEVTFGASFRGFLEEYRDTLRGHVERQGAK